jgi:hypothetical protein
VPKQVVTPLVVEGDRDAAFDPRPLPQVGGGAVHGVDVGGGKALNEVEGKATDPREEDVPTDPRHFVVERALKLNVFQLFCFSFQTCV